MTKKFLNKQNTADQLLKNSKHVPIFKFLLKNFFYMNFLDYAFKAAFRSFIRQITISIGLWPTNIVSFLATHKCR